MYASKVIPTNAPKDAFIQIIEKLLRILHITDSIGESDYLSYYLSTCGLTFMIGRFIGTFFMKFIQPNKLLAIYAAINVGLCLIAMNASGTTAVYAVIGIAFFMSIMFPTIFSLGIKDLGGDTKFGSSLIIMSIVGGAILPPIFGKISDITNDIQMGYIVPLVCFAVIFLFGSKGYKVVATKI